MKQHLKAVLGVNVVSLLRLGSDPRSFLRASRNAFAKARRTESADLYSIPEISLDDILDNRRLTISLSVAPYEDGMLPTDQAVALLSLLVAEQPGEVLEIGTYTGHTTKLMADNLKTAIIHTVHLPEDFSGQFDSQGRLAKSDLHLIARRVIGREFRGHPCENRIVQYLCDTAIWDFSKAGRPTFLFIDGSHTYEYCKSDSENCSFDLRGAGRFSLARLRRRSPWRREIPNGVEEAWPGHPSNFRNSSCLLEWSCPTAEDAAEPHCEGG